MVECHPDTASPPSLVKQVAGWLEAGRQDKSHDGVIFLQQDRRGCIRSFLLAWRAWPSCSRRTCQQTDLAAGARDDLHHVPLHGVYPRQVFSPRGQLPSKICSGKPAAFSVSCGVVFGLIWFLANRECSDTSLCVGLHTQLSAAVALGVGTHPRAVVYSLSRRPQWGTHPSCVLHVFRPTPHLRMLVLGSCW